LPRLSIDVLLQDLAPRLGTEAGLRDMRQMIDVSKHRWSGVGAFAGTVKAQTTVMPEACECSG